MAPMHPTYRLGPDFDAKLGAFVKDLVSSGFNVFAEEFERIDKFVDAARDDRSDPASRDGMLGRERHDTLSLEG